MNIQGQVLVWTYAFISFGWLPGSGITRSYGNSLFHYLECLPNLFSKMTVPFYISTPAVCDGSDCITSYHGTLAKADDKTEEIVSSGNHSPSSFFTFSKYLPILCMFDDDTYVLLFHQESVQTIEFEDDSGQEFRSTLAVLSVLLSFLIETLHSTRDTDIPTMEGRRMVLHCLEIPAPSITRERPLTLLREMGSLQSKQ